MSTPLRILMGNWIWHRVAGEWAYVDNLQKLYESRGHQVLPFSMKHPRNVDAGGFEQYFIENINYLNLHNRRSIPNIIKAFSRSIYSQEARKNIHRLLADHPVDVAHFHDVNHYLTPSVFPELKKHGIPILMTLHDYTPICPESTFVSNGTICERCKGGKFYQCALHRCKKGALLPSVLAAMENMVHRGIDAFQHVDYFLCPSRFLYNKFREFNFYPEKLIVSNLCCEIELQTKREEVEPYIIYAGRLAKVKGILTLLEAMKEIPVKLLLAGDGPEAGSIREYIAVNKLEHVHMLGFQPKEALFRLIQNAVCSVCPSEWYENFPYAVTEAQLLQTPVVAASTGGIPELVIHEETGLLFEPGNARALRLLLLRLLTDTRFRQTLAARAYTRTRAIVNYEHHYLVLKEVYARLGKSL